jgi:hypothetical protein
MCERIFRVFNRVQVVHRRVQQSWCSSCVTELYDVRQCAILADLLVRSGLAL